MAEEQKSTDVLGIKPFGDAVNTLTKGAVEGAGAFLGRICLPAAGEFGLLLQDKVRAWRAQNATRIANKAEALLKNAHDVHAHPRVVWGVLEHGSWCDEDRILSMWAGLLATACDKEGNDEANLLFVRILSQLTSSQVRVLNYACEKARVDKSTGGWIAVDEQIVVGLDELIEVSGLKDIHRLDLELDQLRDLGLLEPNGGFQREGDRKST